MKSLFPIPKKYGFSNKGLYKRAVKVIPGGVSRNTIFRDPHPYYVTKANGSYIKDIDGVERLDLANNMASLIHGHSHPDIVKAVTEQLRKGTAFSMGTEAEIAFAELLTNRTPSFEKIRFVNSGTEAVMTMIKSARAYTGKTKIAKAEGAYHGSYDYAEISQTANPSNWGNLNRPNPSPVVQGTPQGVLDDVIIFPFNDIERTIHLLNQHANEIACVLIDPIPHRVGLFPATNDFVEAVYNWTRKNNSLLAFDEVVSYRVNYEGAQENYTVKPDLTAMGKIIGGGFPIGALAGSTHIMNVLNPRETIVKHPHSGTFSANPISTTAGRIAMQLYDKKAVLKLNALAQTAKNQLENAIKIADVPVSITGSGSMFRFHFQENAPTSNREAFQTKETLLMVKELLDHLFFKENILMVNTCTCMLATSLTQKDIDKLSEGILNGLHIIKPHFEKLPIY